MFIKVQRGYSKMAGKGKDVVQLVVRVPKIEYDAFKSQVRKEDTTISQKIRGMIRDYIGTTLGRRRNDKKR